MEEDETSERVVELLHNALHAEVESAYQYLANANALQGVRGEIIAEDLRADFQEETNHAAEIAERLEVLDEVPVAFEDIEASHQMLNPPEITANPADILEVIEGVIEAEEEALEMYNELAREAEDVGDRTTRRLAEELIEDEEHHLDEFESYRMEYQHMLDK